MARYLVYDAKGERAGTVVGNEVIPMPTASGERLARWLRYGVPGLRGLVAGTLVVEKPIVYKPTDPFFWLAVLDHFAEIGWSLKQESTAVLPTSSLRSRIPSHMFKGMGGYPLKGMGQPCKPGETSAATGCTTKKGESHQKAKKQRPVTAGRSKTAKELAAKFGHMANFQQITTNSWKLTPHNSDFENALEEAGYEKDSNGAFTFNDKNVSEIDFLASQLDDTPAAKPKTGLLPAAETVGDLMDKYPGLDWKVLPGQKLQLMTADPDLQDALTAAGIALDFVAGDNAKAVITGKDVAKADEAIGNAEAQQAMNEPNDSGPPDVEEGAVGPNTPEGTKVITADGDTGTVQYTSDADLKAGYIKVKMDDDGKVVNKNQASLSLAPDDKAKGSAEEVYADIIKKLKAAQTEEELDAAYSSDWNEGMPQGLIDKVNAEYQKQLEDIEQTPPPESSPAIPKQLQTLTNNALDDYQNIANAGNWDYLDKFHQGTLMTAYAQNPAVKAALTAKYNELLKNKITLPKLDAYDTSKWDATNPDAKAAADFIAKLEAAAKAKDWATFDKLGKESGKYGVHQDDVFNAFKNLVFDNYDAYQAYKGNLPSAPANTAKAYATMPKNSYVDTANWPAHDAMAKTAASMLHNMQNEAANGNWGNVDAYFQAALHSKGYNTNPYLQEVGKAYNKIMTAKAAKDKPISAAALKPDPVPKAKVEETAAAPAPGSVVKYPQMKDWKETGKQLGSTPGGKFKDPSTGKEYYVKFQKSNDHAHNEVLAAKLYDLAGCGVSDYQLVQLNTGKLGTASPWIPSAKKPDFSNALDKEAAVESFATHVWLANWDAIGATDQANQAWVVQPDGSKKMITIDTGGAMKYGGIGAEKEFGTSVKEFDNFLNSSINKYFAKVFSDMTPQQLLNSCQKVAAVTDEALKEMVDKFGPGDAKAKQQLYETLLARKKAVAAKAEAIKQALIKGDAITKPTPPAAKPAPAPAATAPADIGGVPAPPTAVTDVTKNALAKLQQLAMAGDLAGVEAFNELTGGSKAGDYKQQLIEYLGKIKNSMAAALGKTPSAPAPAAPSMIGLPPKPFSKGKFLNDKYDKILQLAQTGGVAALEKYSTPISGSNTQKVHDFKMVVLAALKSGATAAPSPKTTPAPAPTPVEEPTTTGTTENLPSDFPGKPAMKFEYTKQYADAMEKHALAGDLAKLEDTSDLDLSALKKYKEALKAWLADNPQGAGAASAVTTTPTPTAPAAAPVPKIDPNKFPVAPDLGGMPDEPKFISNIVAHVAENNALVSQMKEMAAKGDAAGIEALAIPPSPKLKDYKDAVLAAIKDKPLFDKMKELALQGDLAGLQALPTPVSHKVQEYKNKLVEAVDDMLHPPLPPKKYTGKLEDLKKTFAGISDPGITKKIGYFLQTEDPGVTDASWPPVQYKTTGDLKLNDSVAQQQHTDAFASMPADVQSTIKSYTGGGYSVMNASLWSGTPKPGVVKMNKAIIAKAPTLPPGTKLTRRLQHMGGHFKELQNAVGKVLQETGIGSTSISEETWHGNLQMNITCGPGVKGLYVGHAISQHPGEREIIVPAGTRYLVQGYKKVGNTLHLEVIALPTLEGQCC